MQSIGGLHPLEHSERQLRLLRFVSPVGEEFPKVKLETLSTAEAFSKESSLPYRAISYTWGQRYPQSSIFVGREKLLVNQNCRKALLQAQRCVLAQKQAQNQEDAADDYYWIDAICIDQQDHQEKANQVQLMGQIYDNAVQVLSCIGDEADDSNLVMDMLQNAPDDLVGKEWPEWHFGRRAFCWLRKKSKTDVGKVSVALESMLDREYFKRVWVLQEVFGKQSRTFLCCGRRHVPFKALFALKRAFFYANFEGSHYDSLRWLSEASGLTKGQFQAIGQRWAKYEHPNLPASFLVDVSFSGKRFSNQTSGCTTDDGKDGLEEVLDMASSFGCSDARDRIYGTLQLVDWRSRAEIHPDYRKSRFELALEVLTNGWHLDRYPDFAKVLRLPGIFRFFERSQRSDQLDYFEETKQAILKRYQAPASQADQTRDMRCLRPRWKQVDVNDLISKETLISLTHTCVEEETHALIASYDDGEQNPSLALSGIIPKPATYSIVVFVKKPNSGSRLQITAVHLCEVSKIIASGGQSFDLFFAPLDALVVAFAAASVKNGRISEMSSALRDLGGLNPVFSSFAKASWSSDDVVREEEL